MSVGSVEDDDTADVLSVAHRVVPLVDLVERVGPGHEVVQVQLSLRVHLEEARDVATDVARAEDDQPV